jgi:His-Xaa-Ser system protein HxsD
VAEIRLSKADYEFDTLIKMAHRMGHFFSIDITSDDGEWLLSWKVPDKLADESVERIRNEIYEQVIRDKISDDTKPIRDLIFAAAFSNIKIK